MIIALLAALLATASGPALQKVKIIRSANNLRTIGLALNTYLAEKDNFYPLMAAPGYESPYWSEELSPYLPPAVYGYWKKVNTGAKFKASPPLMDPLLRDDRHQGLGDYGVNNEVFRHNKAKVSAASNPRLSKMVLIMAVESASYNPPAGGWYIETANYVADPSYVLRPGDRGTGKILSLFGDGHTEAIPKQTFTDDRRDYLLLNP